MVITEKKQVLLEIIEEADEKLTGLLLALANEYISSGGKYSTEEIEEFYRIRDKMKVNPETNYTPEQAHNLIRNDEKLTGLLIALANEYNDADQNYTDEELTFFEERRDAFFKSDKKGYCVEEAHEKIRNKYKNGL